MKYRIWTGSMMEPWEHVQAIAPAHFEKEWKVLMFTGLLDKTGKDIYEGDVFDSGQKRGSDKSAILYKVHWDDEGACWGFKQLGGFCLTGGLDKDKIVVIGNVHENPELLKP